jgi:hypothetical protein
LNGLWAANIISAGYSCLRSVNVVANAQVAQLSAFIDQVSDKSRPSIVMGDFNMNGKELNSSEYADLIKFLKIMPAVVNPSFPAPDQLLNVWPSALASDIDNGDLARETPISDWIPGQGTLIRAALQPTDAKAKRPDYIFVRNPIDRAGLAPVNLRHIMRRTEKGRAWTSPWPGPADRSSRLSDHMPILSELELAPYFVPGVYHPTWLHDLEFRVTSYDTTGIDDCWGCDALDVYLKLTGSRTESGLTKQFKNATTPTCNNLWAGITGRDACMNDWFWKDPQIATTTTHQATIELWDKDDLAGSDDRYDYTDNTTAAPEFQFFWADGSMSLGYPTQFIAQPNWTKFYDNAPVARCTRTNRANICLKLSITERGAPYP